MGKPFQQIIKNVQGSTALVESKKGNIYPVIISDYVRIKKFRQLQVGNIALVRRINGKYYLIDVKQKQKETTSYMAGIPAEQLGFDY